MLRRMRVAPEIKIQCKAQTNPDAGPTVAEPRRKHDGRPGSLQPWKGAELQLLARPPGCQLQRNLSQGGGGPGSRAERQLHHQEHSGLRGRGVREGRRSEPGSIHSRFATTYRRWIDILLKAPAVLSTQTEPSGGMILTAVSYEASNRESPLLGSDEVARCGPNKHTSLHTFHNIERLTATT